MQKIIHFIPNMHFGGAERFLSSLASDLQSKTVGNIIVTLFSSRSCFGLPETVPVIPLFSLRFFRTIFFYGRDNKVAFYWLPYSQLL
jgi:hypothetical protein